LVVIPPFTVSHYAFKRDVPGYREGLTHGESRFNLFEFHVVGRFLPPVETIMKPEV
jgi:hypothetical protein